MKALVLAGGYPQIALLNELRSRKINTILADYYESPVAKPFSDMFYQVSTLDIGAIQGIAEQENVDFVITACTDQALLTVAQVSETLGLPCYINYNTALKVTNKEHMKEVFHKNSVPTARYVSLRELQPDAIEFLNYPMVVKPVDCNSSKGVKKVENVNKLRTAFRDAQRMSRSGTVIVEEFIDGDEISVDGYVENGVAHVLAVSISEKIQSSGAFVIFRALYPALINEDAQHQIQKIVQQIADAFGLTNTPLLVQTLYDGNTVRVVEFSARTGGGVKYKLIERVSGFDVIKAIVDLTLGKRPRVTIQPPQSNYISNEFIYCNPGVFDRASGFSELKEAGIITDYFTFKWRGAHFKDITNSGDRVAGFTIQAETLKELKEKHHKAVAAIRILDTHGEDIIRRDLLSDIRYYD